MKNPFEELEPWYVTGSQHLYGPETLRQVAANAEAVAAGLNQGKRVTMKIVGKGVMKTPEEVRAVCLEANSSSKCIGLVLWMHTFSPAKCGSAVFAIWSNRCCICTRSLTRNCRGIPLTWIS